MKAIDYPQMCYELAAGILLAALIFACLLALKALIHGKPKKRVSDLLDISIDISSHEDEMDLDWSPLEGEPWPRQQQVVALHTRERIDYLFAPTQEQTEAAARFFAEQQHEERRQ